MGSCNTGLPKDRLQLGLRNLSWQPWEEGGREGMKKLQLLPQERVLTPQRSCPQNAAVFGTPKVLPARPQGLLTYSGAEVIHEDPDRRH